MTNRNDIEPQQPDADMTGDSRFDPRQSAQDRPFGSPYEPRSTPPHGDVSPDGKRIWPQPSLSARILVWGGTGIAAAALTAGTILAARRLAELAQGRPDDAPEQTARPAQPSRAQSLRAQSDRPARPAPERPMPGLAPRFADLDDRARQDMRDRTRERELEDALASAQQRAEAAEAAMRRATRRSRPTKRDFMKEVEDNTRRLGHSAESTIGSLSAAFAGFRAVASQAGGIISEFEGAARLVRGLMAQGVEKAKSMAETTTERAAETTGETAAKDHHDNDKDRRQHRL